jgi:hypothetical protein
LEFSEEFHAKLRVTGKLIDLAFRQFARTDLTVFDLVSATALNTERENLSAAIVSELEADIARLREMLDRGAQITAAVSAGDDLLVADLRAQMKAFRPKAKRIFRPPKPQPTPEAIAREEHEQRAWDLVNAPTLEEFAARLQSFDAEKDVGVKGEPIIFLPLEAKDQRPEKLWLMIKSGADAFAESMRRNVMHKFALQDRKEMDDHNRLVAMLLSTGLDLEAETITGKTALMLSIADTYRHGGEKETEALLKAGAKADKVMPVDSGRRDDDGKTLLMVAASRPAVFEMLLQHGANPKMLALDGTSLRTHIERQIGVYDRDLAVGNMSGNLTRAWKRFRKAYAQSLALLG